MSTERREPNNEAGESAPIEHSNAIDGSPSDIECRRPQYPCRNRLRDLLYDKDFLWKVFGYLVEDGLDECRRVCRRWRDVCSEFYTKHICVHWEDLADAHLKFANAVSLSMRSPRVHHRAWPSFAPSLASIRHLEMDGTFLMDCRQSEEFSRQLCEYIASSVQLESLTLGRLNKYTSSLISSMAAHLTNLTHLKIVPEYRGIYYMEPLPGVCKLKSLSLHANNLFAVDGSLTFPSLTNLTRLEVRYLGAGDVIYLKALMPYASTLKSLAISCVCGVASTDPVSDWTALSELSRMESLCIPRSAHTNLDLSMEINGIRHLTELHVGRVRLEVPGIKEVLFGLTNLKSLGCNRAWGCEAFLPDSLQHLTGLTKLDTDFLCSVASIRHLTNLVILRVSIDHDSVLGECPSFNLKLLEELDVQSDYGFKGDTFSDLPKLKRLCIRDDRTEDGDFFTALND